MRSRVLIRRHSLPVRLTHWVNVVCLAVLLMSGLQIFNAHPALYWGDASDFERPLLAVRSEREADRPPRGVTSVLGRDFDTTGVLGVSRDGNGALVTHAFPSWSTLPSFYSLSDGRKWHFLFAWFLVANGVLYLLWSLASRHLWRDMVPRRIELRQVGHVFWEHLRFKYPEGDAARRYNVLQQLAYLGVIGGLLPLMVLTGLCMSPRFNAAVPELLTVLGGRQSARTLHFVAAASVLGFVVLHVGMVVASGAWNNMRSMVTGRYAIRVTPAEPKR